MAAGSRMMSGKAAEEKPGLERQDGAGFEVARALVCGIVVIVVTVVVEEEQRRDRTGSVAGGGRLPLCCCWMRRARGSPVPSGTRGYSGAGVRPGVSRQARARELPLQPSHGVPAALQVCAGVGGYGAVGQGVGVTSRPAALARLSSHVTWTTHRHRGRLTNIIAACVCKPLELITCCS